MINVRAAAAIGAALIMALAPVSVMAETAHTHAPVAVPTTAHHVSVNGKQLTGVTVFADHLYVPADGFAAAIGATLSKDSQGVDRIEFAGQGVPTLAQLQELNPALAKYQPLSPYIPGMGIHMGIPGPALILSTSNESTLNAVEVLFPAEQGWQPWFDQPKDQPMEMEGAGKVYTQHLYLTDSAGLVEQNAGVPVIIGGRYLSTGYGLKAHKVGVRLYIPLRPAVELLGGTLTWDQATLTAAATVDFKGIRYDWLKQLNPSLTKYGPISEFVPNMGIHVGVPGPHLTVMVDNAGMVAGFELVVPAVAGWAPWFDQPEGQPMELPGLGPVYTQHLYLVDPGAIK